MAIIKCKMCGGDVALSADKTFGICEYCGSTMTFPKISDEQLAARFNRGNEFRRRGEFDKALAVYEGIVREEEENAEAHWCCALCRFGIEYVEDPATFEYIPTCHRASFDSFLEDMDYLAAIEHSDGVTKRQYQRDAIKIAEVQKGILATSQNEEPFDVFICYKESDDHGERTRDSLMAQDVYYQLTEAGYRVFFSRITLEDKAGAEFEPYIFAALNSAKVMVAIGTKPEHFNAVWVKNEWSRFLAFMRKDRSKLILPCYKDMDPYDLPEQLSVLQSYDMAKIGFIQDLIRGIKKVIHKNENKPKETVVINQNSAETTPLLKRAFMFLEDRDWSSADEYCEKVLDIDPECAEAYLGKLMAELRCSRQADLRDRAEPFENLNNYEKVLRFADTKLKTELTDCIKYIYNRNEHTRVDGIYQQAKSIMGNSKTESDFKLAAEMFQSVAEYEDSSALVEKCLELAETARKDAVYDSAKAKMTGEQTSSYENAIQMLELISGWKNADRQIILCRDKIKEIQEKEEQERLERELQAELRRRKKEKRKKKNKKIAMIVTSIVCVCIAFVIVLQTVIIPSQKLKKANALIESGDYIAACELLNGLNYQDSEEKLIVLQTVIIPSQKLKKANALIESGDYIAAYELLNGLNYQDSEEKLQEITPKYYKALWALWADSEVGDIITFGTYEQDNSTSNGKEDIKWQVLDKRDGKILVISRYALDCKPYNSDWEAITWENCSLRKWLNSDFLNAAFTVEEQKLIPTVTVSADKNPEYPTNPGNATQDQIFLLSIPEVNRYFSADSARICKPTPYAVAKNAYESDSGTCWWWLRSPGDSQYYAADVFDCGGVDASGDGVSSGGDAVRPAFWIDLES